ncbi:exodeoxyribonuclease VII large subunit [Devosia pacifica]|nr:exodeoxyribonuclease VII large subunit [Devosia pacifica]
MSDLLSNVAEFSVTEISQALKRTVEDQFGYVRVRGEISGFRGQHASGHAYFTLKDESASIDAVVWKGTFSRLSFKPQEGLEVIATGRLTTFARASKYQLVIDNIEPAGAGALMALLEERRKRLAAEGLFARERKRALPYLPRIIGVITSPTGAVIRDILHRLDDRFPSHVLVWPVRVQGETSALEVVNALEGFNALEAGSAIPRPELLIVARGGGSIEDLWGFNDEALVRAVANSAIPVISAVGHETDTTLVDYAADMRAPTPTAAAEAAVPVRGELIGYVEDLAQRQRHAARRTATGLADRLRAARAGLPRPYDLVATHRQRLDHAASNLFSCLRHSVQERHVRFSRIAPRLDPRLLRQRNEDRAQRLEALSQRAEAALRTRVEQSRLTFSPVSRELIPANRRLLERKANVLAGATARLAPQVLRADLRQAVNRLTPLAQRLQPAAERIVDEQHRRLASMEQLLNSLSYRSVVARGFAVVRDADGEVISAAASLAPGQGVNLDFADGTVGATISGAPPTQRRRPKASSDDDDPQESLF